MEQFAEDPEKASALPEETQIGNDQPKAEHLSGL
jgi:hypothetical protein